MTSMSYLYSEGFLTASKSYAGAVGDLRRFFPDGLCCNATLDLSADNVSCPGVDSRLSRSARRRVEEQLMMDPGEQSILADKLKANNNDLTVFNLLNI